MLEDHIEAGSNEGCRDGGDSPVDAWGSSPAEPEETDGEEEAADGHGREARFGDGLVACRCHDACVAGLVGEVDEDGKEDADKEGEEGEGGGYEGPVAVFEVDYREDFQGHVEEGVDEPVGFVSVSVM